MAETQSQRRLGIALVVAAAIAWSTAPFFTRLLPYDSWTILFWRGLFGGGVIVAIMLALQGRTGLRDLTRMSTSGWLVASLSTLGAMPRRCFCATGWPLPRSRPAAEEDTSGPHIDVGSFGERLLRNVLRLAYAAHLEPQRFEFKHCGRRELSALLTSASSGTANTTERQPRVDDQPNRLILLSICVSSGAADVDFAAP
jgi:hypothetical protein